MSDSKPSPSAWPLGRLETQDHCPVCGEKSRTLLYSDLTDRIFHCAPGEWSLYRCEKCNSAYLDPRPTPETIGLAYNEYYTHESTKENTFVQHIKLGLRNGYINHRYGSSLSPASGLGRFIVRLFPGGESALNMYVRHLSPNTGTVVDIGCGNGEFLKLARALGWITYGIDPDPVAVEIAKSTGASVRQGTLPHTGLPAQQFDLVTLSHVIEHVHDPLDALRECLRILKPGGKLWIATPNIDSFGHERFRQYWRGLEPPRHLVLFNRKSLELALVTSGFSSFRLEPQPPFSRWMYRESLKIEGISDERGHRKSTSPGSYFGSLLADLITGRFAETSEFITVVAEKPLLSDQGQP